MAARGVVWSDERIITAIKMVGQKTISANAAATRSQCRMQSTDCLMLGFELEEIDAAVDLPGCLPNLIQPEGLCSEFDS